MVFFSRCSRELLVLYSFVAIVLVAYLEVAVANPPLEYSDDELRPTAAIIVVTDDIKAEFQAYIDEHGNYDDDNIYGLGDEFTVELMRKARFKYALNDFSDDTVKHTRFASMTKKQIECRMAGYLEYCDHPFGDGQTGTDVTAPYHADFIIADEPFVSSDAPDVQNFPLFVHGIVPVFNIDGIEKLILTKPVLARIFRGCSGTPECLPDSITMWNHTDIKASNPVVIHDLLDAAGPITVIVEQSTSHSTNSFKEALSRFEASFNTQIGPEADPFWNGTANVAAPGMHGVLRLAALTPGSISYGKANMISEQAALRTISLIQGEDSVVDATHESLFAAFSEIGLDFGNDGTDPTRMTIDLTDARGLRTWPIASVGYLAFTQDETTEQEDKCIARRIAMLSFFEHLYDAHGQSSEVFTGGLAGLTIEAAAQVYEILRHRLKCNGTRIYKDPAPKLIVTVEADESLHEAIRLFGDAFPSARVQPAPLGSHLTVKKRMLCFGNETCVNQQRALLDAGSIVLADENLSSFIVRDDQLDSSYSLVSLPFCAMATGFIYNFCPVGGDICPFTYEKPLVLTIELAALILDLQITWWNDTRIMELNPDKVLPEEHIIVVSGPKVSSYHFDFINLVRKSYLPSFGFQGGGIGMSMYLDAWIEVSLSPFAFSFVPFNGTVVEGVNKAALLSRQGFVVQPETSSIEACARDSFDESTNVFLLSSSEQMDCWPLVQMFNLFMRQDVFEETPARFAKLLFDETVRTINRDGETTNATKVVTVISVTEMGTLVDVVTKDSIDIAKRNFRLLEMIRSAGGDNFLMIPHNLNLIPESIIIAMYFLMTLEFTIFLGLAIWVMVHRNRKLVRNSSPVFMLQVLLGSAIMTSTIIPLSQQDSYLVPRGMTKTTLATPDPFLNGACTTQPILFSLGFFITFSALFLKSWRLIRIFNNKKLKNLFLRDKQLMVYQVAVILVVVILNLIWAVQSPLVWGRFPVFVDTTTDLVVSSQGICYSRSGIYPALPLLIGVMLVLLLGNYLAYLGRRIPTEFNESKWTAMTMVLTLEAFVIGVPILVLANDQPTPGYIIKSFCCILVPGATVGLIFGPKVAMAYGWGIIDGESNPWRFVKGDSGSHSHPGKQADSKTAPPVNGKQVISHSLNSLVDSRLNVVAPNRTSSDDAKTNHLQSGNPVFSRSFFNAKKTGLAGTKSGNGNGSTKTIDRSSKEFSYSTTTDALSRILKDDPTRRRFRRYLQSLKMEENVRFWDSIQVFRTEEDLQKRYINARAIIQTFVMDSSPLQVNLSSNTRSSILDAYAANDKTALSSVEFFGQACNELFEDLRQSDAFRQFLDNDTFSHQDISSNTKSDPLILVSEPPQAIPINPLQTVPEAEIH